MTITLFKSSDSSHNSMIHEGITSPLTVTPRPIHILQKVDYNGPIFAIQELPFEILRHIFLLAVTLSLPPASPTGPPSNTCRRYRLAPALVFEPLSFTHVCRWWRAVSLALPELWTAVSGMHDWTRRTTPGVLRVWLAHARASTASTTDNGPPLALDLHLAHPLPTPPDARDAMRLTRVLRLFWAHIAQVRTLHLRLESGMLLELRSLIKSKSLPPKDSLTTEVPIPLLAQQLSLQAADFTFVLNTGGRASEINVLITFLRRAPELRSLRWVYLPTARSYTGIEIERLPWEVLEEVRIRFPMSLRTARACISRCVNVKMLLLETVGWAAEEDDDESEDIFDSQQATPVSVLMSPPTSSPTLLPHLTSLTLYALSAAHLLTAHLILPALRVLHIRTLPPYGYRSGAGAGLAHTHAHGAHITIANLKAFLLRSECALDELLLRHPTETLLDSDVNEFFALPGISKLSVLDLCYFGLRDSFAEFHAGGGQDQLAQLGMRKVVVWGCGPGGGIGYQPWEEHIGWKRRFGRDEVVSEVFECV